MLLQFAQDSKIAKRAENLRKKLSSQLKLVTFKMEELGLIYIYFLEF